MDPKRPENETAWMRGLTQPRLSRRQLVHGAAGFAVLTALGPTLAACGVGGTKGTGSAEDVDWTAWWQEQKATKNLSFANWPLYIDTGGGGKHPSLEKFTKESGINVSYKPVIQDNAEFFSKISPVLQAGDPIGYDIIVMSNGWELGQLIANRWLTPLDHSQLPNFKKYAGEVATRLAYDEDLEYSAVWQAGVTGIAYDPKLTGGEIDSVEALFDPKFKGKVGMLSDNDEVGSLGLLALGIDPATSTYDDWKKSAAKMKEQRDKGIVRQYYDNSYIKALQNGDVALTQAYSGDIFQSNNSGYPDLKFVVPKEGAMLWRDNSVIPLHAKNPVSALKWIDFYYQPENQAMIADWINYISPVPDAQPIIRNKLDDPVVADSPLVFPPPSMVEKLHGYPKNTTPEAHAKWTGLFDPIIQS